MRLYGFGFRDEGLDVGYPRLEDPSNPLQEALGTLQPYPKA